MRIASSAFLAFWVILWAGCGGGAPDRPSVLAVGYVGPATLNLRKEIPLDSPVVATVKHGERLDIIRRRRVFLQVRTSKGAEGWTSERLLLSAEEMEDLRRLSEQAAKLPSQGIATCYDLLNVHTDSARLSPSFMQIKPGDRVDVVLHRVAPRTSPPRPSLIPPPPKRVKKTAAKKPDSKYPPLALPPVPRPPSNWQERSKTAVSAAPGSAAEVAKPAPVAMDDWSLIRIKNGQAGWVLTSRLQMAIPDEVAQYAEGKRITSYFSLAEVQDEGQVKHVWLWTTISSGLQSYDFDSFRVFIWNVRRHRYETAYIERNVTGYFPVKVHPVTLNLSARVTGTPTSTTYPGFSVCLAKEDGQRYRRNYAFITNVVRFAGESPCETRTHDVNGGSNGVASAEEPPASGQPSGSLLGRWKARLGARLHKWWKR
jgi:hypothetical protein